MTCFRRYQRGVLLVVLGLWPHELQALVPEGTPEHSMQIFWVDAPDGDHVQVTTTGALIQITPSQVVFTRLIDPATNDVAVREVGRIEFEGRVGPFALGPVSKRSCVVQSESVTLDIRSDSLVFIANPSPKDTLAYVYRSLVKDAPYAKGAGADRFWADGRGGSLHASDPQGGVAATAEEADRMRVTVAPGRQAAVAVFPPRKFDFERLYGREARPHCYFTYATELLSDEARQLPALAKRGFGVLVLFSTHYALGPTEKAGDEPYRPAWNPETRRWEYSYQDPAAIARFVQAAHAQGFRVITYFSAAGLLERAPNQPLADTLAFMREFQRRHHLDGWYFDNAGIGPWPRVYDFVRQVRADVGENGVIYHHDSVDVWGAWSGCIMVPVDAYVDYTLKGETGKLAETHSPNDAYFGYFTAGYGTSQAIAAHKLHSAGGAGVTSAEVMRLLGQNLNGSQRSECWALPTLSSAAEWDRYFRPFYEARRQEYLSGHFAPRMAWPVTWFREAQDVRVTTPSPESVRITWRTEEPTTSQIRYTTAGRNDFREHSTPTSTERTRDHTVVVQDLTPGTAYRFALRSANGSPGANEIVWGYVGTFSTPAER